LRNLARLIHRLLFIPHAVPPRADTAPDLNPGASSVKMTVPSHGEMLLGIFYEAAGPGKHPTVVLPHGFPGYEQNLDLAQAMRRAGWNVLAMHYRGSWGVGGDFSLAHASEDADAMVAFAHSPEPARKYHIDPDRIVVVGHSMGGYMAAWAAAHESASHSPSKKSISGQIYRLPDVIVPLLTGGRQSTRNLETVPKPPE